MHGAFALVESEVKRKRKRGLFWHHIFLANSNLTWGRPCFIVLISSLDSQPMDFRARVCTEFAALGLGSKPSSTFSSSSTELTKCNDMYLIYSCCRTSQESLTCSSTRKVTDPVVLSFSSRKPLRKSSMDWTQHAAATHSSTGADVCITSSSASRLSSTRILCRGKLMRTN